MKAKGPRRRHRHDGRDQAGRRSTKVADELAAKRHGRIEILVNNAGIARSVTPRRKTVTDEHWLQRHRREPERHFLVLPRLRQAHAGDEGAARSSTSDRCPDIIVN